jgi:hypothetical protein
MICLASRVWESSEPNKYTMRYNPSEPGLCGCGGWRSTAPARAAWARGIHWEVVYVSKAKWGFVLLPRHDEERLT